MRFCTFIPRRLKVRGIMRQRMHIARPLREPSKTTDRARDIVAPLNTLLLSLALLGGCAQHEESQTSAIHRDHEAISQLLDAALLSEDPRREFQNALPRVRAFATVDSAWMDGNSFFVVYKEGGLVSWTAPPGRNVR